MKKQYIVTIQGIYTPRLFSVEKRLKQIGEVEMLCHYRVETSVFKVSTEDPMCDAQKIKYAIKDLLNPLVEKASIYRVNEADCDETESVVEQDNPHGFPYCFSRFKTVAESRRKYEEVKPEFVEGHGDRKKHREMTFVEYLLGRYTDYEAKEVDYNSYLYRFFSA